MTGNEFKAVLEFERDLAVGDKVVANWTNSFTYYTAPATVAKLNAKSVIVTLDVEVRTFTGSCYPVGHRIKLPRMITREWSPNNCLTPAA